jgi:tartronate-semialdehyde synthase
MVTGLYSASADSIPILCITGQAPRARMHKEDFQAVDITSIVKPVTKWATTVLEPGQVPYAFQKAFYEMRSGRPGPVLIDLPFDVQMAEIEFDIDAYQPLPLAKPPPRAFRSRKPWPCWIRPSARCWWPVAASSTPTPAICWWSSPS